MPFTIRSLGAGSAAKLPRPLVSWYNQFTEWGDKAKRKKVAMLSKLQVKAWLIISLMATIMSQGCAGAASATPTSGRTQTPVVTPTYTLSPSKPTPTQENINTVTSTPLYAPFATYLPVLTSTPGPTPTALIITPDANQPECETFPGDSRVGRTVSEDPQFCITWRDLEEDETGFRIILEYKKDTHEFPNRGETFVYEVGPDVTQLIIPEEHSPFPDESPEWCLRRNDFRITVIALSPELERTVDIAGVTVDCIPPELTVTE